MSLWLDKHRPTSLSKLDYHKEQALHLKKLVVALLLSLKPDRTHDPHSDGRTSRMTGIGKMRKCGMRNAESKMRNAKCGMYVRNGV